MASGVTVKDECVTAMDEVRMDRKYRYIIFSMTDDLTQIKVLKRGRRDAKYNDFMQEMDEAIKLRQCRYAVYDVDFQIGDVCGQQSRAKLVFILWSPDNATIKQKMLYTSSREALRKKLTGIAKEMQATDHEELSWDTILGRCMEREAI